MGGGGGGGGARIGQGAPFDSREYVARFRPIQPVGGGGAVRFQPIQPGTPMILFEAVALYVRRLTPNCIFER